MSATQHPPLIAITGSIATGKSALLNILKELGFWTASADDYVSRCYQDPVVQKSILELTGSLDKSVIRAKIVADPSLKEKLEGLLHPLVWKSFYKDYQNLLCSSEAHAFIFLEVPLLHEAGWTKKFSASICVFCDQELQLKRLQKRHHISLEDAKKLTLLHWPQDKKIAMSDWSIANNGSPETLRDRLIKILAEMRQALHPKPN